MSGTTIASSVTAHPAQASGTKFGKEFSEGCVEYCTSYSSGTIRTFTHQDCKEAEKTHEGTQCKKRVFG
jgi:hypothetical protein